MHVNLNTLKFQNIIFGNLKVNIFFYSVFRFDRLQIDLFENFKEIIFIAIIAMFQTFYGVEPDLRMVIKLIESGEIVINEELKTLVAMNEYYFDKSPMMDMFGM